jgi:hypothetical protein
MTAFILGVSVELRDQIFFFFFCTTGV